MDREKIIKGLEHCKKYGSLGGNDCNGHYEYTDNLQEIIKANNHRKDCPYGQCRTGCVVTLVADVLALLKEQEVKTGHWIDTTNTIGFPRCECSECNSEAGVIWMKYCPNCGAKMEFEGR